MTSLPPVLADCSMGYGASSPESTLCKTNMEPERVFSKRTPQSVESPFSGSRLVFRTRTRALFLLPHRATRRQGLRPLFPSLLLHPATRRHGRRPLLRRHGLRQRHLPWLLALPAAYFELSEYLARYGLAELRANARNMRKSKKRDGRESCWLSLPLR